MFGQTPERSFNTLSGWMRADADSAARKQADEVMVEVYDKSLDQETTDRLAQYAMNILADSEVIVEHINPVENDNA